MERHAAQTELKEALAAQERLLAELQHRISNSLAVITSLLRMKATRATHPSTKQDLADVLHQITVLREVYAQLHATSGLGEIDLGGYITSLTDNLVDFHAARRPGVRAEHRHDHVSVRPALAVNLGLVVNEFITNSLKHAGDDSLLLTTGVEAGEGAARVVLADDGVGIGDARAQQSDERSGSGIGLIEGLLGQLGCSWQWSGESGTRLDIRVPLPDTDRERGAAPRFMDRGGRTSDP